MCCWVLDTATVVAGEVGIVAVVAADTGADRRSDAVAVVDMENVFAAAQVVARVYLVTAVGCTGFEVEEL